MVSERLSIERKSATRVVLAGRAVVAFAGCDYLGLAHHPTVLAALQRAISELGLSASASRETTGNYVAHEELETRLARFLGTEAALLVPDGYLSNLVAVQALAPRYARALVDGSAHASVHDALAAARIDVTSYEHANGAAAAREIDRRAGDWLAVLTDGVYPAHGTLAPLPELLAALPRRQGVLLVDDCHGFGVLGAHGRGTCEHFGVADARIVITGTLSKAAGACGGFVAGTTELVAAMRTSRAYVGSTPIAPALARAGSAAVDVLEHDTDRRARLHVNVDRVRAGLRAQDLPVHDQPIPVFALKLEPAEQMERVFRTLLEHGFLLPFVRYPDVHGGHLRLAVSSEHTADEIDALLACLARCLS